MTDTVTENADVAGYLAAVREALLDLPASDYDDLLEDLEAHLYEVVAESGGASLESSLGTPASYADELRSSAGLDLAPSSGVPLLRRVERRVARSPLWHALGRLLEQPWAKAVREFLPTLRPGWWVLRGWLALFALIVWLHGSELTSYSSNLLVPTYHGNWVIGFASVVVAVVASVVLGLRTARLPLWTRRVIGVASAVVVLFSISMYGDAENLSRGYGQERFGTPYAAVATQAPYHGITVDGRHPLNIYPYDEQGHLLTNVRLFDDRGRPIEGLPGTDQYGQKLVRVLPSDAAGAVVSNEYPQRVAAAQLEQLINWTAATGSLPTVGPSAEAAFAAATPMPTPTVFVPPMAGATPAPVPTTAPAPTPSPSLTPAAKTSGPAKVKARAKAKPGPTSS
jgi:hypothetical protein